jgi:hypothetical protein
MRVVQQFFVPELCIDKLKQMVSRRKNSKQMKRVHFRWRNVAAIAVCLAGVVMYRTRTGLANQDAKHTIRVSASPYLGGKRKQGLFTQTCILRQAEDGWDWADIHKWKIMAIFISNISL